jgi:hypothetical protein
VLFLAKSLFGKLPHHDTFRRVIAQTGSAGKHGIIGQFGKEDNILYVLTV